MTVQGGGGYSCTNSILRSDPEISRPPCGGSGGSKTARLVQQPISSGRVPMINTGEQRKLLHTWVILVIVKQPLVQIGHIDGPAKYSSLILAVVRSSRSPPSPLSSLRFKNGSIFSTADHHVDRWHIRCRRTHIKKPGPESGPVCFMFHVKSPFPERFKGRCLNPFQIVSRLRFLCTYPMWMYLRGVSESTLDAS